MTVGEAVVFDAVAIERVFGKFRHLGAELFIGGVRREESLIDNFPCELLLPCIRCLLQTCLDALDVRILETVPTHPAGVEHRQRGNRLDALVGLRRRECIAAAAANAERTDAGLVHLRQLRQIVHHAADILDAVRGIVPQSRRAAARALIACIAGKGDVSKLRQSLCIQPCHLLLARAVGMRHGHGSIFLVARFIVVCGKVEIRGNLDALHFVRYGADVHLARDILRQCALIDEPERILVRTLALARRGTAAPECKESERHQKC